MRQLFPKFRICLDLIAEPSSGGPAAARVIGVRPEDVVLNGGGVAATMLTIGHLGVESVALLEANGQHFHALLGAHHLARRRRGDGGGAARGPPVFRRGRHAHRLSG